MADDRQDRIRQRAHQIWEQEGRPEGAHERHWRKAENEIAAADGKPAMKPAATRKPGAATRAKSAPAKTASPAADKAGAAPKPRAAARPKVPAKKG